MDETPNLNLPFIMEAQAQKHVTHNEAIRALDAVVQLSVLDRDLLAPPTTPTDGDRYIVGTGATGAWLGQDLKIAAFQDGVWAFYQPKVGWLAWVADEAQLYAWSNAAWVQVADSDLQNIPMVGVNTTADSTNRFSVSAAATLLNHEGAGHQTKINKAAPGNTASLLFQTGFSGRAEFGTTGDDDWHVKVSADGSNWNEALIADKASGAVRFPAGMEHGISRQPVGQFLFTPGGDGTTSMYRIPFLRGENPQTKIISSVSGDIITLTTNDAYLYFGQGFMNNVSFVRVWNLSKLPVQSAWIKAAPATSQLQVLDAGDIIGWSNADILQLGDPSSEQPGRTISVDISPMMQNIFGVVFPQKGIVTKVVIQGNGSRALIGISADGSGGSFSNVVSLSTGDTGYGNLISTCTTPSPISNSNLILIREKDFGTDTILFSAVASVALIV